MQDAKELKWLWAGHSSGSGRASPGSCDPARLEEGLELLAAAHQLQKV